MFSPCGEQFLQSDRSSFVNKTELRKLKESPAPNPESIVVGAQSSEQVKWMEKENVNDFSKS